MSRETLLNALFRYGEHLQDCEADKTDHCTCGLRAAIAEAREEAQKEQPSRRADDLRDRFAAAAVTGLLSNLHDGSPDELAAECYLVADALLNAREDR